jgi:hypothetical protein
MSVTRSRIYLSRSSIPTYTSLGYTFSNIPLTVPNDAMDVGDDENKEFSLVMRNINQLIKNFSLAPSGSTSVTSFGLDRPYKFM